MENRLRGLTPLVFVYFFMIQNTTFADNTDGSAATSVAYILLADPADIDSSQAVLNPHIKFAKKVRFDFESGVLGDELIANANYTLVRWAYYAQDDLSYGIGFRLRTGGLTPDSEELQAQNPQLALSVAPKPTTTVFVSLGYNLLYGKLGFSESKSINTITQLNTDFGLQTFGNVKRPILQLSFSQLFFIDSSIAIGVNLGLSVGEVTDPTSTNLNSSLPAPNDDQFNSKILFGKSIGINLNVLL